MKGLPRYLLVIIDCLSIINHFRQIRNAHLSDSQDFLARFMEITDSHLSSLLPNEKRIDFGLRQGSSE